MSAATTTAAADTERRVEPRRALRVLTSVPIAYVIAICVAATTMIAVHLTHIYTSDDVGLQVVVSNWSPLPTDTFLPIDTFIIKTPVYWLVNSTLGFDRGAVLVTTLAFTLGAVTLTFAAIWILVPVLAGDSAAPRDGRVYVGLIWAASLASAGLSLIVPNGRNIEVGIALLGFAIGVRYIADGWPALLPDRLRRRWIVYAAAGVGVVAAAVFIYNDPYYLFLLFAPFAAACLVRFVVAERNRRLLYVAGFTVAAFVVSKLVAVGFEYLGVWVVDPERELFFDDPRVLFENARLALRPLLFMFGATPTDLPPTASPVGAVPNLLVLVAALAAVVWFVAQARIRQRLDGFLRLFLAADALFILFAFIGANTGFGDAVSRYLILLVFLVPILIAALILRAPRRLSAVVVAIVAIAAAVNVAFSAGAIVEGGRDDLNSSSRAVAAELRERELTRGYTDHWYGPMNTYFSGGEVDFLAVDCAGGRVGFKPWFVELAAAEDPVDRSFFAYDPNGEVALGGCDRRALVDQFGEPVETFTVTNEIGDTVEILVFDYDVKERFVDTLSEWR